MLTRLTDTTRVLFVALIFTGIAASACSKSPSGPSALTVVPPPPTVGVNLSGTISGFSGSRASFQFAVNGQAVRGDAATAFATGSQFAELSNGLSVQVIGAQLSGHVYANSVSIVSQPITFTGRVITKTGTAPDLVLVVTSHTVMVRSTTAVSRKGLLQTAASIANGQTLDVRGRVLPDGTVVASAVDILSDTAGGPFIIEAAVDALTGMCPQLRLTVHGYDINTNMATSFMTPCAGLNAGDKVEVQGFVQQDMTITASSLIKK